MMSLGGKRNLGSLSSQQINARAGTDIKTISLIPLSIVSEDICVAGLGADASLYRRSGTLGQPILGVRSKCEQPYYYPCAPVQLRSQVDPKLGPDKSLGHLQFTVGLCTSFLL